MGIPERHRVQLGSFFLVSLCAAVSGSASSSQYPLLHIGAKINCSNAGHGCTKAHTTSASGFRYSGYDYPMTEADADVLGAFSLIHVSTKDAAEVALWHQRAPRAPAVKYIESVPVCGGSAGQQTAHVVCNSTHNFETGGFRRDAMVYHAGNLTEPLAAGATSFRYCGAVVYCCGRYGAPLRPSTAPGPYGDYGNGSRYVTFARLGDELMKIVAASNASNPDPASRAPCQRLTVERGLDGTMPAAAPAGAPLLAPTFAHTPAWAGPAASGKLAYQADYRSSYAWSSLANFTADAVEQLGYDGAWFDSFSPSEIRNGADPEGNKVSVWDVTAGRPYTRAEAFAAQMTRLQRVWAALRARLGRFPKIWVRFRVHVAAATAAPVRQFSPPAARLLACMVQANNFENWLPVAAGQKFANPGDREFMLNTSGNRPFDGCSLESWTASFDGSCFEQTDGPGVQNVVDYVDEATWIERVNVLVDAARLNLSVAAMTGSAGCQSYLQTYLPAANRTAFDLLHYASFLLAVRRGGGGGGDGGGAEQPLLGTSAFFAADAAAGTGVSVAKLWEPYTWQLGAPIVPAPAGLNVTAWRVPAGVYVRFFAGGAVLVNPGDTDAPPAQPVALAGGPYENRLTGETGIVSVRGMPRRSGLVLLRAPS